MNSVDYERIELQDVKIFYLKIDHKARNIIPYHMHNERYKHNR